MLKTLLTTGWGLRHPIIGAPMANAARGRLARAITLAGGLGMIGVGSKDSPDFIQRESAIARGDGAPARFGIGLMAWLLEARPELLDAAIREQPFLISISFGSVQPYSDRLHRAGILLATQVNNHAAAVAAAQAGAGVIVAQGTEAGGHTGFTATLPLLQIVLEAVDKPVLAAGGIGTAAGLSAVLAAAAEGAWIGTRFLLCPETDHTDSARERLIAAKETDTIHTSVFDRVNRLAWPEEFPGRALRNAFAEQWDGREQELMLQADEIARFRAGADRKDYDVTSIYAGQAVGLLKQRQTAAEVVHEIGDGAERLLRERLNHLLGD
ncbi:MAG: NAD(P)H-dependent flavin oxidoreductase [Bryobacteraceae bacterium]